MSDGFKLISKFKPEGDQPQAIKKLTQNLREGLPFQTLLGVTGSGKTFTMASVIEQLQRPTLIISHNKTLAAQLYQEFKEFFPENAVHYFVSYYDYYQPEAYIPHSDTYIEKDASINELIDRLRHASTQSILSRPDTLIVASVSCIYGIGEPAEYEQASIRLAVGEHRPRKDILRQLAKLQFARNDISPLSGTYNAKGDAVEVRSMTGLEVIRIEWHGNVIDRIEVGESRLEGTDWQKRDGIRIFPAKHFVTPQHKLALAIENIKAELKERLAILKKQEKLLEAQRLGERTKYDLEMIRETGYCTGIENYSRHLDFRKPGTPPATLIDYFKHAYSQSDVTDLSNLDAVRGAGEERSKAYDIGTVSSTAAGNEEMRQSRKSDWLLFIDESHMTIPQIRGMYHGDRARKDVLVEYGFRLPSAMDNRPLTFEEFLRRVPQTVFVSATPNVYEHSQSKAVVEQLIRPTGLLDPVVEVLPTEGQIPRLVKEIAACVKKNERALVVTITKRLAEELTEYLKEKGVKVQYLHSEVKTLDRPEILKDLREGKYDVVVGINLLREGLDLPEVSLVAILDADKEGFLRNETTLIQTIGRAARHINGRVIMFADAVTESMRRAIDETVRRRKVQEAYNTEHGITPKTIRKAIKAWEFATYKETVDPMQDFMKGLLEREGFKDLSGIIKSLEKEMKSAAKDLDFEKAATIRDQIAALKKRR